MNFNIFKQLSITVMVIIFFIACNPMFYSTKGIIITNCETDALLGPDWGEKLVKRIPPNTQMNLVGMEREWYEVQLRDGSYAWVYRGAVRLIPYGNVVTTQLIQIRSGPGNNFSILKTVPAGISLTRLEIRDEWARVAFGTNQIGWVPNNSISVRN